ncbi:MAG TPA: beta-ketoacyl synthase N-terminal-like domain-containing protein [Chryseosolibacter sp.]
MEPVVARKSVWVVADSIVSPLGNTSEENFRNVVDSVSGLREITDPAITTSPIHAGQVVGITIENDLTRFEQMCVDAIRGIISRYPLSSSRTLLILSTTKGNIDLLKRTPDDPRLRLHATAKHIANYVGFQNVITVSNACISGVMAVTVAKRYLQAGTFDHALVIGADELTSFVVSGFQSLGALSSDACKPFDKNRTGINLGEAAAAILLSSKPEDFPAAERIEVMGSGLTNDANHISGPSRTGEELALAITTALEESNLQPSDIDFISAHGTATIYNDEMEAKAFSLARLSHVPLNSLKGYYGHTLGAAGVVELIISIHSLLNNRLIRSLGFSVSGVSQPLNIIQESSSTDLKTVLKTASGFGGCNAAIVLQKHS